MYRFNPGVGVAANANPNQATKSVTYAWTDNKVCAGCIAGDKLYQPGEEGALDRERAGGHHLGRSEPRRSRPRTRRRRISSSS